MALVSERTLFIHLPKTGGSSVRTMMAAAGIHTWESGPFAVEDHYGVPEVRAAHPGIDYGKHVFTAVRHPVPWLKSRWAWGMVTNFGLKIRRDPAAAAHWMACCWSDSFVKFTHNYLDRMPGIYTQLVCQKLAMWEDNPPIIHFLKTESLVDDLEKFLRVVVGETFDEHKLRGCIREKVAAEGQHKKFTEIPDSLAQSICDAESVFMQFFGYEGLGQ